MEPSAEKMEPSAEKLEPSDIPTYQQLAYMPDEAVQLIDLPADFYAVQILAMTSRQALEDYADEHDLPSMAAARVARNGELYYVLLLGVYRDKPTAEEAAAQLPERIMSQNPWVRSMKSLQEAIANADRLASASERSEGAFAPEASP
jgi:septal ring-binding cell division protein DamX